MTLWTLRILLAACTGQVLAQIALAGAFVGGDLGYFRAHSINGGMLIPGTFLLTIVAFGHLLAARRVWPLLACLAFVVATVTQVGLGHSRVIGLHIVLGTSLLAGVVLVNVALWRTPARPPDRGPMWRRERQSGVAG